MGVHKKANQEGRIVSLSLGGHGRIRTERKEGIRSMNRRSELTTEKNESPTNRQEHDTKREGAGQIF